jgi:hypothetical protein
MDFENVIVLSQSDLSTDSNSLPFSKNPLHIINDVTNKILEENRSRSRASVNNKNIFNLYSDSKGTFKRPKILEKAGPINLMGESSDKNQIYNIENVKNDLLNVNDNIKSKIVRMITPSKHRTGEQGNVSKYSCQICGPETCHLCDEHYQRKVLNNKLNDSKSLKSGLSVRSSIKPPQSSQYTVFTDSSESDNTMLLSILLKSKYNIEGSENEIEDMIKSQNIFVQNRSSPYNFKRGSSISRQTHSTIQTTMTLPTATYENEDDIDDYYNQNNQISEYSARSANTKSILQEFDEPISTAATIETTLKNLKKFKPTDYYFKNMKDLREKSFRTKEKLLLTQTPVPTSTNKLFLEIERFDIADKYKEIKKRAELIIPKTCKLLKRTSIDSTLNGEIAYKTKTKSILFKSMKNFDNYEPEFKKFYDPPLLKLQMQKFDEIYDKLSPDKNFKVLNRKNKKEDEKLKN